MRPNSLLISAVTAPTAAIMIAVVLSIFDGWKWENPLGLGYYTVLFVLPFTLIGSFIVVLPAHQIAVRAIDNRAIRAAFVLMASGIVGAVMPLLISEQILAGGLIGAASGMTTALVWLILDSRIGRPLTHD